jgi:hypothetical protein
MRFAILRGGHLFLAIRRNFHKFRYACRSERCESFECLFVAEDVNLPVAEP